MSGLLEIVNDPKNIDHIVSVAIACVSFLVSVIGAMLAIMVKNYKAKVTSELDQCSKNLMTRFDDKHVLQEQLIKTIDEAGKETRKSAYHAHDRITQHVEKHHTKG